MIHYFYTNEFHATDWSALQMVLYNPVPPWAGGYASGALRLCLRQRCSASNGVPTAPADLKRIHDLPVKAE